MKERNNRRFKTKGSECTCDEIHDFHICPYKVDVNHDQEECDCCPACEQVCADDI